MRCGMPAFMWTNREFLQLFEGGHMSPNGSGLLLDVAMRLIIEVTLQIGTWDAPAPG